QHCRAGHAPGCPGKKECSVRRRRQWRRTLGTARNADPDGKAEQTRSAGLVDRCPRTHRVGTYQTERIAHAAAVELEAGVHAGDDQFGLAAKRPVVLARRLQTNGICERFNKTILAEFYQVALRKKIYRSIAELQVDLDVWIRDYNTARTRQGRWCYGKTPMQTFVDTLPVAKEKSLQAA